MFALTAMSALFTLAMAAPANASTAAEPLPPGVVRLDAHESCPERSFCVYGNPDYLDGFAIAEGWPVDLHDLTCRDCQGGSIGTSLYEAVNRTAQWGRIDTENYGTWNVRPYDGHWRIGDGGRATVIEFSWQ